jgi:hypothetical protein
MSEPKISMSNLAPTAVEQENDSNVQGLFVTQKRNGKLYLYSITLTLDDNVFITMHKFHAEYHRIVRLPPYHFYDKAWIFWKPVIEQAVLSEVRILLSLLSHLA